MTVTSEAMVSGLISKCFIFNDCISIVQKLLFLDLKVNLTALSCLEYPAFPSLAISLKGEHKCVKSLLLQEL